MSAKTALIFTEDQMKCAIEYIRDVVNVTDQQVEIFFKAADLASPNKALRRELRTALLEFRFHLS